MAISAAKLEANRRNAKKSTGPRTDEGKECSKFNALKHGLRAETLVLPDEDPQDLEDRRAAWTASLAPLSELEQRAVDDAVIYSWRQDRARRAEAARAEVLMADGGLGEEPIIAKEVLDLGRRLFKDRLGPVAFYPLVPDDPRTMQTRTASTSYPARHDDDDADLPAALVLQLQSTRVGCEWMLGEWARLQSVLDRRQPWISSDKLKAVRLLGRQPFDAIDHGDVALIFLTSHRLKPEKAEWAWEILTEMNETNRRRFRSNAADRELESLMPADAPAARDALGALIQRETECLRAKAEAHRQREHAKATRAADLFAFDETPEGERLRRFEISSGRGYARAIDTFLKLRRAAPIRQLSDGPLSDGPLSDGPLSDGPLSVVRGPLLVADDAATAIAEVNALNEPNFGPLPVVSCPLPVADQAITAAGVRNASNEPTAGPSSVNSRPVSVPASEVQRSDSPNAPDDPIESCGILTNEPITQRTAGPNERAEAEEPKPSRSERLRKPNDDARRAAEEAMTARRAQRREQRNHNGKPEPSRANARTASAGQGTRMVNTSGKMTDLNELLKTVFATYDEANLVPS